MASNDWELIFADMTAEELAEQKTFLKGELKNLYLSQSQGGKSYQRSITDVRQRLASLVRVENMRKNKKKFIDKTVVDFS